MSGRHDPASRARRKSDLLAASSLLRLHAAGAVDELSDLADSLSLRVMQVRAMATSPVVRLTGVTLIVAWLVRRHPRSDRPSRSGVPPGQPLAARLLPWVVMAWRVWRLGGPGLMRWLEGSAPPRRRCLGALGPPSRRAAAQMYVERNADLKRAS